MMQNAKLYCFNIKRNSIKKHENLDNILSFGKIEVSSTITLEKKEMCYAMLQTQNQDFYCAVKELKHNDDYTLERKEISKVF